MADKRYFYEIKDRSGNFKKRLSKEVISEPSFKNTVNSGFGELNVRYGASFDEYGEGDWLAHDYICTLYAVTDTYPSGTAIYSGAITSYSPVLDAGQEYAQFTCVGLAYDLNHDFYRNGDTLEVAHNSEDPKDIIEAIIDNHRTNRSSAIVNYGVSTIDSAGYNISDVITAHKHLGALDRVMKYLDNNWYYRFDGNNILYVTQFASTADHEFTIGKDVNNIHVRKTVESVVNRMNFWNQKKTTDPDYIKTKVTDSASEDAYGVRAVQVTDRNVTDSGTVTKLGDRTVGINANPKVTVQTFEVLDSYSWNDQTIEDIKPGDVCRIKNIKDSDTTFNDTMKVISVHYKGGSVSIQLAEMFISVSELLSDTDLDNRLRNVEDAISALTVTLWSGTDIIKSNNFVAGTSGWQVDGNGDAEFNDITVRGSIEGSTIDIGGADSTSFHVDIDGNVWLGAGTFASAPAQFSNDGNITVTGEIIANNFKTGTSGGRVDLSNDNVRIFDSSGTQTGLIEDTRWTFDDSSGTEILRINDEGVKIRNGGVLNIEETTEPTDDTGSVQIWTESDNEIYVKMGDDNVFTLDKTSA